MADSDSAVATVYIVMMSSGTEESGGISFGKLSFQLNPVFSLIACFILAFSYVASLYIKPTNEG